MCIVFFQAFDPQSPPSSSSSPDTQTPADGGLSAEEQAVAQRYAFVLASNRDEYLTRPTKRAHLWEPQQAAADGAVPPAVAEQQGAPAGGEVILAGKDLLGGGTWLGVTRSGRVSVLTNYRTPGDDAVAAATAAVTATEDGNGGGSSIATVAAVGRDMKKKTEKRSRGQLVLQFLHGGGAAGGPGPLAYGERVVAEVRASVLGLVLPPLLTCCSASVSIFTNTTVLTTHAHVHVPPGRGVRGLQPHGRRPESHPPPSTRISTTTRPIPTPSPRLRVQQGRPSFAAAGPEPVVRHGQPPARHALGEADAGQGAVPGVPGQGGRGGGHAGGRGRRR